MKIYTLFAIIAITSAIFVNSVSAETISESKVNAIIDKAETRFARAQELGHEWTTTAPLLKKAKEAQKKNELSQAYEFARQAHLQAEYSIIQWEENLRYWKQNLPK